MHIGQPLGSSNCDLQSSRPVQELARYSSASMLLIFSGILPIKLASFIQRCLSFFNWVKLCGISCGEKLFWLRTRTSRFSRPSIPAGTPPANQLEDSLRTSSRGKSRLISSGMMPLRLLKERSKYSRLEQLYRNPTELNFGDDSIPAGDSQPGLVWDCPWQRKVKMKSVRIDMVGMQFEELQKHHTSVAIRLRAMRTYNVLHSRGRDQIKSRECVFQFHDEAGSYTHMHISRNSVSHLNDFVEGNVYCIKNFLVVAHWYCYKTCHGIESDPNDWYYDSCPQQNCNKKLEFNAGMYDCGKCGGQFIKGSLRYKLEICVVDVNGTAPLLLWDHETLELLCVKADELKAMQPSLMTKIPKEMRNLKGRGLFFKLVVRSDQLDNLNNALPVMQVKHFPEMVFFPNDPTESQIDATSGKQNVAVNEMEAVKRSLLDEFSSTQASKKKKQIVVKEEKDDKEPTAEH
nr:putative transposase [Ipomoea trifida]